MEIFDGHFSLICCMQATKHVLLEKISLDEVTLDTDVLDGDMCLSNSLIS